MDVQHRNIILDIKVLEENIYVVFLKATSLAMPLAFVQRL
jgi:hypothetical protein